MRKNQGRQPKKWMDSVNKDKEVVCTTSNGSGVGQKQMETSSSSLIIIEMMEESRRRKARLQTKLRGPRVHSLSCEQCNETISLR